MLSTPWSTLRLTGSIERLMVIFWRSVRIIQWLEGRRGAVGLWVIVLIRRIMERNGIPWKVMSRSSYEVGLGLSFNLVTPWGTMEMIRWRHKNYSPRWKWMFHWYEMAQKLYWIVFASCITKFLWKKFSFSAFVSLFLFFTKCENKIETCRNFPIGFYATLYE